MQTSADQPSHVPRRWFEPQRNMVHRFIAYLVVLSLLPLLILGLASFEIARSALESEAEHHLSQLLNERKRFVDLQTEQTEDLIANISGVETIVSGLSAPYDPTDNFARLSMQARIGYILNGYINIRGLVSIDIFSQNGAHYHVGDTLDVGTPRRSILDDLRRRATASTRPVYWAGLIDNVNGNSRYAKVIAAAKVIYGFRARTSEPTALGLLLVNYDPDYLRQQFGEASGGGAVHVALVDAAGHFLAHPDPRLVGTLVDSALIQQLRGTAGSFTWTANGTPLMVSYRRTEPSDWPLVGFISVADINAHASAIGKATALVALLCLGLASLAALLYSRRIVAPLRQITERFKLLRRDGAQPQEHLPVQGEDDIAELTRWFNTFLDGQRERERAEMARLAAEASSEAKSLFLAKMSHDLRTPLNAVLGYAQLLARDQGLNERQRAHVNTIHSSGDHLLTLINDILDLSKVEAGKLELYPEDVNLSAFLQFIADTIRVKTDEKGLNFILSAAAGLPQTVRWDEKRMRQVLLNLLDNAVKFTDAGEVALRVHSLPAAPSAVVAGAARLRFEVEDSGVGIAAEQLEASFRPFQQVGDTHRRTGGTGLGLTICQQLLRVMGSEIHVRSRMGQGTCFWFDLELAITGSSPEPVAAARAVVGYSGQPKKVLVIDDVAENRALIDSLLSPLGFEVFQAENGRVGVDKAKSVRPDLILMDMVMPVMDGLEATRLLRQEPGLQSVPVISLSAIASNADHARSLQAGANAFLTKPIDVNALAQEMGRLLDISWIHADLPQPVVADPEPVLPPLDDLKDLHRLAMVGNMRALRQRAERVAALGEQYRLFASEIQRMAAEFQTRRLLQFLDRCVQRASSGAPRRSE